MLRLWGRLLRMDENRLTKRIFLWDYELSQQGWNNWLAEMKAIFEDCDLPLYYENIFLNFDNNLVMKDCESKLCNKQNIAWKEQVSKSAKFRTYNTIKSTYGCEKYLQVSLTRSQRSLLAQYRCGILPLKIETGRFANPTYHTP